MNTTPHLTLNLTIAAMLIAASLSADQAITVHDGTVSVEFESVPLSDALRAVGEVAPYQKLVIDSSASGRQVSVKIERAAVPDALKRILESAGVNYVLSGGAPGKPIRLIVGDSAGGIPSDAPVPGSINVVDQLPAFTASAPPVEEPRSASATERAAADRALQFVLTQPPGMVSPGSTVELPFPGPDGALITVVRGERTKVLPFPGSAPVVDPAPGRTIRPAIDLEVAPELRQLIHDLTRAPLK
jgi:hypothetical protein